MRLIVGLGNPGKKYELTRHNVGFLVVDELLKKLNISLDQEGFKSFYTTYFYKGEKIIICKPQTYMNLSGEAVSEIVSYYKIKHEDIVVIYDDLDLPMGKLRLRTSGSSGGHNQKLYTLITQILKIRFFFISNKNSFHHLCRTWFS